MNDGALAPVIAAADSVAQATRLLGEDGPAIINPAGETIHIARDWEPVLEHDPQRAALVPTALAALKQPHEIWRFVAVDREGAPVEHQPHLIWSRRGNGAHAEVTLAGTRRIGDHLHLHTWFLLDQPWPTLRRFWSQGTRQYPQRHLQPLYVPERDVLYLHPDPHIPYRATRIVTDASVFGYLNAGVGFPSLVGFEIQDATTAVPRLEQEAEIAGLLATIWQIHNGEPCSLAAYLSHERWLDLPQGAPLNPRSRR